MRKFFLEKFSEDEKYNYLCDKPGRIYVQASKDGTYYHLDEYFELEDEACKESVIALNGEIFELEDTDIAYFPWRGWRLSAKAKKIGKETR